MNADNLRIDSIFLAAIAKATLEERSAYLDAACGSDQQVRERVERLLAAHPKVSGFLESPALGLVATIDEHISERPGTVIGPYKLLEQIGEGGFGVVFMAEQLEPVRRKVALKVIKPGMDTRQVIARFEAERQALALMEHPNIAKVLDAGTIGRPHAECEVYSGRPYFVMELVRGSAMTDYCDQHNLSVRERLELFIDVCQAVQHAHHKGIIHRDIKPSNVLVTLHDGKPVVKVIDFGIAKAMGQQLTEKTLFTNFAQMIGTPLYMSPEQAEMSGLDVDTRSDIYALGVLLYELLTGATPFDKERLKHAGFDEIRRIIREEEPPKPSTRMSTVGQAATTASEKRQSDPRKLSRLFRGELDWIVMKALDKDRNWRYESASAFAADVGRYLKDEPVQACPASALYRFRKFTRRNKTRLVVAGFLGSVVLVAAVFGGWVALWRAQQQAAAEREAEVALAEAGRLQDEGKWPEALMTARRAEPLLSTGVLGEGLLQRVAERLSDLNMVARLEDVRLQIRVLPIRLQREAPLDKTPADAAYALAFREYGIDVTALAPEDAADRIGTRAIRTELAAALDDWALECRMSRGKGDTTWKELLALARAVDPDELRNRLRDALEQTDAKALTELAASVSVAELPPSTLVLLTRALTQTGATVQGQAAVLREAQRRHPGDFWINYELGWQLPQLGPAHLEAAVRFSAIAVALRPLSPLAHHSLGRALSDDKDHLDEAIAEYREAIRLQKDFPWAHYSLAWALHQKGRLDEAIAEFREVIRQSPPESMVGLAHRNLAGFLMEKGKLDEAIREYRAALEIYSKRSPNDETIHNNLGIALVRKGDLQEAMREYRAALQINPNSAEAHCNLGDALNVQGNHAEADAECREALRLRPDLPEAHFGLGRALNAQGKRADAEAEYREAFRLRKDYAEAHNNLGLVLNERGLLDEAIAEFRAATGLKKDLPEPHYNLGNALKVKRLVDEAIAEYQEAIRVKMDYAEAHCNLGSALVRQGSFRQAVEEYRLGHELGSRNPGWKYPSALWLRDAERHADLDARLPKILKGEDRPTDAGERLAVAQLCQHPSKQLNFAAACFYGEALAADSKLAADLHASHRYNAACTAALAGCSQGKDTGELDGKERERLRRQALAWLRADLAAWKQPAKESDKTRPMVHQTMRHWQQDEDFAGVRGEALVKLPEAERQEWQKLWQEVEELGKWAAQEKRP